MINLWR